MNARTKANLEYIASLAVMFVVAVAIWQALLRTGPQAKGPTAVDSSKQLKRIAQLEIEIKELEELKSLVDFYDPNILKEIK